MQLPKVWLRWEECFQEAVNLTFKRPRVTCTTIRIGAGPWMYGPAPFLLVYPERAVTGADNKARSIAQRSETEIERRGGSAGTVIEALRSDPCTGQKAGSHIAVIDLCAARNRNGTHTAAEGRPARGGQNDTVCAVDNSPFCSLARR